MTDLIDFQHDLGGVLIGAGTPVRINEIEGLGLVESRVHDVEPPTEDGLWLGVDYLGGRTVRIDAGIRAAGNPTAVLDTMAALHAVASPDIRLQGGATTTLRLKLPGRPVRVVRGRLRRAAATMAQLVHGWVPLDIEFQAADATYYGDYEQTVTIPISVLEGGGFTAPVVAPILVDGPGDTRPGRITVDGTAPAWPVLTIHGPTSGTVSNVRILHIETGRVLEFPASIPAGQWVTIDTRPTWRTVTLSGGGTTTLTPASRIDQFALPPGDSELRWTATDPTLTASLDVRWTPAFTTL